MTRPSERQRASLLHQSITDADVLVYAVDGTGTMIMSEGGLLRAWGIAPASTIGTTLGGWASSQVRPWPPYDVAWPQIQQGAPAVVVDHVFAHRRHVVQMRSHCYPRWDAEGRPDGMLVIATRREG